MQNLECFNFCFHRFSFNCIIDGERAEGLRTVSVKILDNDVCDYYYGVMTDTMMCTSGENGHGPCLVSKFK